MVTAARTMREELRDLARQLAALNEMTVGDLSTCYRELYGEPTRSRNRGYLLKRLRWRIQENAEGGLSKRCINRIAELGDSLPERWRIRQTANAPAPPPARDPRLPERERPASMGEGR